MEPCVPPPQRWFVDLPRSESEHSVRSCLEELADHAPDEDAFSTLSLAEHFDRNRGHLRILLEEDSTRTEPVQSGGAVYGGGVEEVETASRRGEQATDLTSRQPTNASTGSALRRRLITTPTASRMKSLILHPSTYRGLPGIESSSALAEAMGVSNWEQEVEALQRSHRWPDLRDALTIFGSISDSDSESVVTGMFCHVLSIIASALGLYCRPCSERVFGMGGLLADKNMAFRGKTDAPYMVRGRMPPVCHAHGNTAQEELDDGERSEGSDVTVLTCEFKRGNAFPYGHVWYHGSRGVQTLGALWSGWLLNRYAPALLLCPKQFKLLLVRDKNDMRCACPKEGWEIDGDTGLTVYEYPDDYSSGRTDSSEFLEMLVIVLLSTSKIERVSPEKPCPEGDKVAVGGNLKATPDGRHLRTDRRPVARRSMRKGGGKDSVARRLFDECEGVGQRVWFVDPTVLSRIELMHD